LPVGQYQQQEKSIFKFKTGLKLKLSAERCRKRKEMVGTVRDDEVKVLDKKDAR
jgi:hypothetical protein